MRIAEAVRAVGVQACFIALLFLMGGMVAGGIGGLVYLLLKGLNL
jgi:cell division protein FtsX